MKYIIMTDVEKAVGDAPPEKGHKAYTRKSPKGKLENIKQAGIVRRPQEKKKEPTAGKQETGEKQPLVSDAKVGSTITVEGGGQAKVTAVGKDGVTATDDKGQKYQVVHTDVQVAGESETKPGTTKPGQTNILDNNSKAKAALIDFWAEASGVGNHTARKQISSNLSDGRFELLSNDSGEIKIRDDHTGDMYKYDEKSDTWDYDKGGKREEHKFSDITPKSETDAGVIDEFKKLVEYKVDKGWVVPDPKHDGVFLMFTTGPKGEKNAAIYYRGSEGKPGDFEEVDFDEAVKKYGKPEMKKELEGGEKEKSVEKTKKLAEFHGKEKLKEKIKRESEKKGKDEPIDYKKISNKMREDEALKKITSKGEKKGPASVENKEKKTKKMKLENLSDNDWDVIDGKPDKNISTGFEGSEAATDLGIYYKNNKTYVTPGGESENAEPWKYDGKISVEDVLNEYYKIMKKKPKGI